MQTTLQFGNTSTIQEWTNFKGLRKSTKAEPAAIKNHGSAGLLIDHLTKQLEGSSVIKMWELRQETFNGGFNPGRTH